MITEFDIDEFENGLFGERVRDTSVVMTSAPPVSGRMPIVRDRNVPIVGVVRRMFKDGTSMEETFLANKVLQRQVFDSCGCTSQKRYTRRFRSRQELRTYLFDAIMSEAHRATSCSDRAQSYCSAHLESGIRNMNRFDALALIDQLFQHESIISSLAAQPATPKVTAILSKHFTDGSIIEQGLTSNRALYQRLVQPCGCVRRWEHRNDFQSRERLQEFFAQLLDAGYLRLLRTDSPRSSTCLTHEMSAS